MTFNAYLLIRELDSSNTPAGCLPAGGLATEVVLGAKDVAFPKLNLLSFYVYILGSLFTLYAIVSGGLDTGWTFYTPFSTTASTSAVVPAALAMAERQHASGQALLRAVVVGYDICARTSKALGIEKFRSAGHSTHSYGGTFGAAAADLRRRVSHARRFSPLIFSSVARRAFTASRSV